MKAHYHCPLHPDYKIVWESDSDEPPDYRCAICGLPMERERERESKPELLKGFIKPSGECATVGRD